MLPPGLCKNTTHISTFFTSKPLIYWHGFQENHWCFYKFPWKAQIFGIVSMIKTSSFARISAGSSLFGLGLLENLMCLLHGWWKPLLFLQNEIFFNMFYIFFLFLSNSNAIPSVLFRFSLNHNVCFMVLWKWLPFVVNS